MTNVTDDNLIPQAVPDQPKELSWLTAGVHNVIIKDIRLAKRDDGSVITSRKGFTAMEIEFSKTVNGKEQTHIERYYVGQSTDPNVRSPQFKFDEVMTAAGVDNKGSSVSKQAALGKRLWIAIRNEYPTTDGQTIELNDKGYRKSYHHIFDVVQFNDPNNPPTYDGDPNETKESPTTGDYCYLIPPKNGTQQAAAPASQPQQAPANQEAQPQQTQQAPQQGQPSDWE